MYNLADRGRNEKDSTRLRHIQDMSEEIDAAGFPMHYQTSHSGEETTPTPSWSNLGSDKLNVIVLIFLYVLQGIPLGLAGSMPMILQARKADYSTQAFFSFAFWPFSVKLIWAPIVDSLYFSKFGRRKSWLVPTQYLIGLFMYILSFHIKTLLGENPDNPDEPLPVNVTLLTMTFIGLCFLAATQDIAVDGWALTMLDRSNVGWASTCNTVGQTAGYFLASVVFLALESADFCNSYLRSEPQSTGLVTIQGFMYFWAVVFITATTLTAFLKSEKPESPGEQPDGILDTYMMLFRIIKLPAVMKYCIILLTCKIAFAATDAVAGLKLIDAGMPKEKLAMIGIPMVPIQIILPIYISKYTSGDKPLSIFLKAYPMRIGMSLVIAGMVYITPMFKNEDSTFPALYYCMLITVYAVHQVTLYCVYVSLMAFTAKVSDPAVGGTYMTLLNTITNLGGNWPATVALYIVSHLDVTSQQGETTTKVLDGFYIETALCTVVGCIWLWYCRRKVDSIQSLKESAWKVSSN